MARYFSAMLVGAILCFVFLPAIDRPAGAVSESQDDPKNERHGGIKIALVDMARVFTASKTFNSEREKLKERIADSEKIAQQLGEELKQLQQKQPTTDAGSDERKEIDRKLAAKKQEFEKFRAEKSRGFLSEESKIYSQVYEKSLSEIEAYAKAHDIDMVMRSTPTQFNPNLEPNALLQSMNRQVLYENKLDITDEIIAAINDQ